MCARIEILSLLRTEKSFLVTMSYQAIICHFDIAKKVAFWGRMRCQGDRDFACFINQVIRNASYYGTLLRMSACFLLRKFRIKLY